jgi:hypothetical protein
MSDPAGRGTTSAPVNPHPMAGHSGGVPARRRRCDIKSVKIWLECVSPIRSSQSRVLGPGVHLLKGSTA